MKESGYQKLKHENDELKEKLALYENGVFDAKMDEHVVEAPQSFIDLMEEYIKGQKKEHPDYEEDLEDAFFSVWGDVINSGPYVRVIWKAGKEIFRTEEPVFYYDYLVKLGDGDPAKGMGVKVARYRSEKHEERV